MSSELGTVVKISSSVALGTLVEVMLSSLRLSDDIVISVSEVEVGMRISIRILEVVILMLLEVDTSMISEVKVGISTSLVVTTQRSNCVVVSCDLAKTKTLAITSRLKNGIGAKRGKI